MRWEIKAEGDHSEQHIPRPHQEPTDRCTYADLNLYGGLPKVRRYHKEHHLLQPHQCPTERGNITVQLTSGFTGLDSTKQVNLSIIVV